MQKQQIDRFNEWFDKYVAGFYGDDDYVNANIKLKEDHSKRVCSEMRYLADELKLSEEQKRLAEAIALFHDIGRFEQFSKYRTYTDHKSVDHSRFGLQVLAKENVLGDIDDDERTIIEKAIEYHNIMKLPAGLNEDVLLFSRLIRDADKLDIYYVSGQYYKQYEDDPKGFRLEVELPDTPVITEKVAEDVIAARLIDYRDLYSWNDVKLCQLSWVYDVNFVPTLKRIRERGFVEMIAGFLPQTKEVQAAADAVRNFIEKRIKEST
jgi:putative nucleotidyltransferase with HDIG domain